ncbi:MAG TPA: hypothetical protein VGC13_23655 [Longimicrobium sp.]|uniref:hypothetical protein n=1 Tax=Longimicrobium sp. TaxID=2029185 RepID=UPI002EDB2D4C
MVLRVAALSYEAYPMLTTGTLTVQTDGQTNVLRALPDRKRGRSHEGKQVSYVEDFGFELHGDLLQRLCSARAAGLCFKNYRGPAGVDAATVARFQAYCRSFYELAVQPVE